MRTRAGSQAGASAPACVSAEDTSFAYLSFTKVGSCVEYKVDLRGITITIERSFNNFCHVFSQSSRPYRTFQVNN